jgi:dethiobiotin synthetase
MKPVFFITGIGTDVGKTLVSAIIAEAMEADYWKPIQAGYENGTDAGLVSALLRNPAGRIYPEVYSFTLPASPHIAAREDGLTISLQKIKSAYDNICMQSSRALVIEGAGGLMVPLNESETILDLISLLGVGVIIVSRNYLGSINHSLMTAKILEQARIPVMGWIFNDHFMDYEKDIAGWSHLPILGSIPFENSPAKDFVLHQAALMKPVLKQFL